MVFLRCFLIAGASLMTISSLFGLVLSLIRAIEDSLVGMKEVSVLKKAY